MKKNVLSVLVASIFLLCLWQQTVAISLIYNMKIRRVFQTSEAVTMAEILGKKNNSLWLVSGLPIFYERKRHIVDQSQNIDVYQKSISGGMVFNLRHVADHSWWCEATTAMAHEHSHVVGTHACDSARTGMDDIVLAAGYTIFPSPKTQIGLYGIGGIPTQLMLMPQEKFDTLIGTRFFSVGGGAEFSNSFISSLKRSLVGIFQVRGIHFFDRRWNPILPCDAKIRPGNLADILLTMQYREKRTVFEMGYNVSFFSGQALRLRTGPVRSDTFLRNSFYASILHLCNSIRPFSKALLLGGGFYVGRAKKFDTKIGSCWLNLSVVF